MTEPAECCICLQPLFASSGDKNSENPTQSQNPAVGVLICGHPLHFVCALQQLEHKRQCPMCRMTFDKSLPLESILVSLQESPPVTNQGCNTTDFHVDNGDDFVEVSKHSNLVVDRYMASLSDSYQDLKRKVDVLNERAAAMATREEEMRSRVQALTREKNTAVCTESALRGRWEQELTARAEAEELALLRQCAVDNKKKLMEAQHTHAMMLRELNEIIGRTDSVRQRTALLLESTNSRSYKKLRSEMVN